MSATNESSVRAEVVSAINQYLTGIRSSGPDNILAVCPFHRHADGSPERTPSFAMSLVTGLYICHSCKEKGNLRQFLVSMGVSHLTISKQYGLLLDYLRKQTPPKKLPVQLPEAETEPLPEDLLGVFDHVPLDLVNKGFSEKTIRAFDVGFDLHNMRITFPLRDLKGRLVGISGRSVTNDARRFKVYDKEYAHWGIPVRRTSLYGILWNVDRLYAETYFGVGKSIIVVEGYKACMWVHQAGIRNVVALCGSYLNEGQRWILEHLGAPVYLMLDNDKAGKEGTKHAARLLTRSLPVYIIRYNATQPDALPEQEIPKAIEAALDAHLWMIEENDKNGLRKTTLECS